MDKSAIVPLLIDDFGPTELTIRYADQPTPLQFGQELRPAQVQNAPEVSWPADPQTLYTLLMTDPDAPSARIAFLGEVRHWLVVNIPGSDIAAGNTLSAYLPSGPPPFSGLHRYAFFVFEQKDGRIAYDEKRIDPSSMRIRFRTSTRATALKYNLGNPIGAKLFLAKY